MPCRDSPTPPMRPPAPKRRRTPAPCSNDLTRKPLVQALLARLAAAYILLVRHTTRWQVTGDDAAATLWADNKTPFMLAFWHGRLLLMTVYWQRNVPMNMLISQHADGELIAQAIGRIGVGRHSRIVQARRRGGRTQHGQNRPRRRMSGLHPRWPARTAHACHVGRHRRRPSLGPDHPAGLALHAQPPRAQYLGPLLCAPPVQPAGSFIGARR